MKKLIFITLLPFITWATSDLLKLAGVEVYAFDSEKKLKIEQMDLSVLDVLEQEIAKNKKNLESGESVTVTVGEKKIEIKLSQKVFVSEKPYSVYRGSNTFFVATDAQEKVVQYSGPLNVKMEGKNESTISNVDLVKLTETNPSTGNENNF